MGYVVRMPQLGMTMEEGMVVEWLVEGDETFEAGDPIVLIESEKTTNEIEAREPGVMLERYVDREQGVPPGTPIAFVGEPGESVPEGIEMGVEDEEEQGTNERIEGTVEKTLQDRARPSAEMKISPRAQSYATEHGIDQQMLFDLSGTGPDGAIVEADVIEFANAGAIETAGTGRDITDSRQLTSLRRSIAERMTQSATDVPQVTLNRSISMSAVVALKTRLAVDRDLDLSLTDFILKAVANAIDDHPEFNAIFEDATLHLADNVNIGIAVDIEGGLVTPVIHGVDQLELEEINRTRKQLVQRVQTGDFTMDDMADGTFTVTNLGHFGIDSFDPLLNVPEVAILGLGRLHENVDAEQMTFSLTFDHRAVDGADAARFLHTLAEELAHPTRLLTVNSTGSQGKQSSFIERSDELEGPRLVQASLEEGLAATLRTRRFEWLADEPEEAGGTDRAPTPVEQFLASLASCLTLTVEIVAERREISLEDVNVTVSAEPEHGSIERLVIDIEVVSDGDEADLHRVVKTAERGCPVSRLVDTGIERDVSITIRRG